MGEPYETLDVLRLVAEFLAALVGAFYFFKLKDSYWKWFSVYLVLIFAQEMFWYERSTFYIVTKPDYYNFFGIPIQYVFLYWLYGIKSLKRPILFAFCILIYLLTLLFKIYFDETYFLYSFNSYLGTALLILFVVLEFIKQLKDDSILKYWENKMFYINLGVIIFYAGGNPFLALNSFLYEKLRVIWHAYYIYFLIAICLMYLLFAASFIWGKKKS